MERGVLLKCDICGREKEIKGKISYNGTPFNASWKLCEDCDFYFKCEIRNRFRTPIQYGKVIE